MRTGISATTMLALACVAQPLDTEPPRAGGTRAGELSGTDAAREAVGSLLLAVPGQLVVLSRADGRTERAWVQAQITIVTGRDGVPIADGAILVVSAADGPMPQTDPGAEATDIRVTWAAVDGAGSVTFEGSATTASGKQESPPFEVSGTARPESSQTQRHPDYIVWDIVGGNALEGMSFRTTGTLRSRVSQ